MENSGLMICYLVWNWLVLVSLLCSALFLAMCLLTSASFTLGLSCWEMENFLPNQVEEGMLLLSCEQYQLPVFQILM